MLVAYEAQGLHVDELPTENIKLFLHQIGTHDEAQRILAEAVERRPDVQWFIVGKGPWGVRGEPIEKDKKP
jgi:hypothetical protein